MSGETRSVKVVLSMEAAAYIREAQRAGKVGADAMKNVEGATRKQTEAVDALRNAMKEFSKRAAVEHLGNTAGKVGLLAAAGFTAATLKAADFDQAMSNIRASTGETASNMDLLRAAALKAGADTAFSASEAASAIEELSKAGVSTKDILGGGLAGALDLAAAGGINVGEAAEYAAKAMSQFGLAGDQVPHVADLLAAAAGKAVGEVGDFGQALDQVGLVAAQTGIPIEDTVGALAAFAQAGLQGSDAGTSFKAALQRLQNPLGQGAKTMAELGINAYDAQGRFIGITALSGELQSKLGGLTQAQRDAAMAQIFGSDAVRAASILYREGADGIQGWINKTNDAGFAAEQAATRMDNLKGDLEQLGGALETALIGTGDDAQGPLRKLTQGLTGAVNAYNDLGAGAKSGVGIALGATAALGGGTWAFTKIVTSIGDTRGALRELGVDAARAKGALSTVGAAAGGIAAVTAAAKLMGDAFQTIQDTRIESGGLGRDLTALADGRVTSNLENLSQTFSDIQATSAKWNPLSHLPFTDWDPQGFYEARKGIKDLDEALASMVDSGSAETAAAAYRELAAKASDAGVSQAAFVKLFPEYSTALENGATETNKMAGATRSSTEVMQDNTSALKDNLEAMDKRKDAALAAFDAETAWQQALVDAREQAKSNTAGIRGNSEEVLANRSALSRLAGAWNDQDKAVRNNVDRYESARRAFIDTAEQMGVTRERAKQLADEMLKVPQKISTDVLINDQKALTILQRLQDYQFRDKYIRVHTLRDSTDGVDFQHGLGRAAGGILTAAGSPSLTIHFESQESRA